VTKKTNAEFSCAGGDFLLCEQPFPLQRHHTPDSLSGQMQFSTQRVFGDARAINSPVFLVLALAGTITGNLHCLMRMQDSYARIDPAAP
jgi:hypothetical protein